MFSISYQFLPFATLFPSFTCFWILCLSLCVRLRKWGVTAAVYYCFHMRRLYTVIPMQQTHKHAHAHLSSLVIPSKRDIHLLWPGSLLHLFPLWTHANIISNRQTENNGGAKRCGKWWTAPQWQFENLNQAERDGQSCFFLTPLMKTASRPQTNIVFTLH